MKESFQVYQAYLSTNPEVRIRRNVADGEDFSYFIAIKSDGKLTRREVEIPISKDHFYALTDMIEQEFISKEFRIYELPNGLELECSLVDSGLSSEFMYAEVEFRSIEEAERFKPCFDYVGEITRCDDYKMKNYWRRTRGEK